MKSNVKFAPVLAAVCVALLIGSGANALPTNLATSGTANASSFHSDYVDPLFLNGPENAINGNRSSRNAFNEESIYHGLQSSVDPNTQYQELWYEVDLGTDYYLDRVQLFSRLTGSWNSLQYPAASQHTLQNFRIDVFNTSGTNVFSQMYLPSKSTDDEPWAASDMRGVLGSRVRLSRDPRHKILGGFANSTLLLAELEVWGQNTPPLENLALGRPVTATPSKTLGIVPHPAESAVDGNLSGHLWHESVYESDPSGGGPFLGPYGNGHFWQVELADLSNINHVTIYARTDGEPSEQQAAGEWAAGVTDFKNGPIRISVIGADGTSVIDSIDTTLGGDDLLMQRYDLTEVFGSNPAGKFLRIESLDTTKTLTFGEVEVFGTAVASTATQVPEPNAILLVALSLLAMFVIRCPRSNISIFAASISCALLAGATTLAQPTNLAPSGTPDASSKHGSSSIQIVNAADGDRNPSSIWHSANGPIPDIYGEQHWYEVDLGSDYYLDRLQIFPRNDFQDTVKNFTLKIFDSADNEVFSELFLPTLTTGDRAWGTTDIRNVFGSRVRIIRDPPHTQWDRSFTFAEFEVWGQNSPIADNLALNQTVTGSTPLMNAGSTGPELANDGYIGGHFWHESVYVSDDSSGAPFTGPYGNGHYWQVELEEASEIDYVNVFARSDDFEQNGPIRISVIDSDGTTVVASEDTTLGGDDLNFNRYDITQVFATDPVGKFVRIEALDTTLRLALAEVEVFGPAPVIEGVAGDFNGDGKVDAADYALWRDNNGSLTALENDDNLGTPIGSGHYTLWQSNFGGMEMGAGGATSQNVPEPASIWLLSIVSLALAIYYRR